MLADNGQMADYVIQSESRFSGNCARLALPGANLDGKRLSLAYSTDFAWTQEQGLNNTTVYRA